ncbi:hypothetical protein BCY91_03475 [Pelobium manganitolerans]|uniref:Plasmid stabilization protein n=1 Tax=Pelobium manganitolerans TaxID=1842495 RepID=A0A419S7P7_9SPHI|nr:type II toxin-antitoxin system RelE/ParE family toxin [Pelobium manganitolerans]RKD17213.1 hypothetical protein BCY91_03475 [Pelobium manganitolerans]
MNLEVRWSDNAELTFDVIYDFTATQWGLHTAEKLKLQVIKILKLISVQPYSFQECSIKAVRKAVVSRHTSFFYEVFDSHILILFFWDNRQQPII